ncbi:hypothetical protein [Paludibacter jiangxiensis]|uniref:Nucleotide-diphospho-sugar transferase n=1 Tax=Paludibacter jiangxiensis TaxID=681398 RepID=A0A161L7S1_9BACT|nr:hypothetical protein [Paludibacter jiangxiensis]GAT62864.1 hypothetical protein PJIAN_3175 [Paludibacter jiangxiensis]
MTTPILFIIFNRIDTTKQVFEAIRSAQPSQLFVASDGARTDRTGEEDLCREVREYVMSSIDWECEVKTLFRDKNLGCGLGPATAITWFFEHVDEGIILEDDCLPHPDFFGYCAELLEKYRNNNEIAVIGGDNFNNGKVYGSASYYFSKYSYTWGWATWRRVWEEYRFDLKKLDKTKMWRQIDATFHTRSERDYWKSTFEQIIDSNRNDAWDYQLWFHVWYTGRCSIAPNVNLVKNIGFGDNATHTTDNDSHQAALHTNAILPLTDPSRIKIEEAADYFYFKHFWSPTPHKTLFEKMVSLLYAILPQGMISSYRKLKKRIITTQ